MYIGASCEEERYSVMLKPFVFVVFTNVGSIKMYNISGNIIKSIRQK